MFKQGKSRYTFENICLENNNLRLEDGVQKIFLNAKAFLEEKDIKLQNLLAFINGEKVDNDSFINRLAKKIHEMRNNKEWRVEHMKINLREQDAFYDGLYEGKLEGKLEGRLEGELNKQIEIAKNLLHYVDNTIIVQTTGLSFEQVQKLREKACNMVN